MYIFNLDICYSLHVRKKVATPNKMEYNVKGLLWER